MSKVAIYNKGLESVARRHVVGILREILSDPDSGLILRKNIAKCLKKSIHSKKTGRYKNLDTVLEKYSPQ